MSFLFGGFVTDLKKQWDAAVVAVEERKTQLVGILALGNDVSQQVENLDAVTNHLLDSTNEAKTKVLEGIVTPSSSTTNQQPALTECTSTALTLQAPPSTPSSMPSPSSQASPHVVITSPPTDEENEPEPASINKESVQTAAIMVDKLTERAADAELLAKQTGDDASIIRDRIDNSLRKFSNLVNRRLSLATIVSSVGKKTLDEQLKDIADWVAIAEARLTTIQRSFDQQLTAISTTSVVPLEELNRQHEDLLRELNNQICQMEAMQKQHPDVTAVHAFRDRMNRLQYGSKELGEKLAEPTWLRIAAALKLQTTWASSTHAMITADFRQLPASCDQLTRLRARLQEIRREIEVKRPVVDRLINNGHAALVNADSSAVNDLGKCLRSSREKWDLLLTTATRAEQRLTTATPLITELETCSRLAVEKLERAEQSSSGWVAPGDLPIDALDAELERVRSLELALLPIQSRLDCLEQLCDRLNQIDAPLETNARTVIENLRLRWRNLHTATAQRHAELHRLLTEFGPHHFLAASVEPPWERALTQPGRIPYYVNHQTETTSWDHPAMLTLVDSFRELNNIRFAAYRTGQKLRAVQRITCLDQIPLLDFARCCDKLGFPTTTHTVSNGAQGPLSPGGAEIGNAPSIDILDMVACLSQVFESAAEQAINNAPMNVPLCVDLTLNWLLNVYDPARTGRIRLAAFKTGVALLVGGTLEEKYRFLFRVAADSSGRCDARRLALLIHDCLQLPRHFGEVAAFGGTNVEPSVRSCLALLEQQLENDKGRRAKSSPRPAHRSMATSEISTAPVVDNGLMVTSVTSATSQSQPLRVTVDTFLEWLQLEPQSFVWLPVLYRLALSETAEHPGVRCAICKSHRLIGLRYRCLRCFSFDICQTCFFSGRVAKSHKLTHPIQEYCTTTTSSEEVRDLTTVFCNQFRPKSYFKKHRRFGYLPVQTVYEGTPVEGPAPTSVARHSHPPPVFDELNNNEISYNSDPGQPQQQHDSSLVSPISDPQPQSAPPTVAMPVASSTVASPPEMPLNDTFNNLPRRQPAGDQQVMPTGFDPTDDEHLLIARYARVLEQGSAVQQRRSSQEMNGDMQPDSPSHTSSQATVVTVVRHQQQQPQPQSPMQILATMEANRLRDDVETRIRQLEGESARLQAEYSRLLAQQRQTVPQNGHASTGLRANGTATSYDGLNDSNKELSGSGEQVAMATSAKQPVSEAEMASEARLLRHHRDRLELRLRILEEHNGQLENQLARLRLLLADHNSRHAIQQQPAPVPPVPPQSTPSMEQSPPQNNQPVSRTMSNPQQQPSYRRTGAAANMSELLQMADSIGQAVGTLVTVLTDSEGGESGNPGTTA